MPTTPAADPIRPALNPGAVNFSSQVCVPAGTSNDINAEIEAGSELGNDN